MLRVKATVNGAGINAFNLKRIAAVGRLAPVVQSAQRWASQPVLRDARKLVPVKRGVLKKALVIVKSRNATRSNPSTNVTARRPQGNAAHLVELGTRPHWQPKRQWMHPGAIPKPFLGPAFHRNIDNQITRLAERLALNIEATALSLARRGKI